MFNTGYLTEKQCSNIHKLNNRNNTVTKPEHKELVVTIQMVARNFKLLEESAEAANRDLEHEAEMRLSDHLIRFGKIEVSGTVSKR